jgi:ankyrin repeat protein
VVVPALGMLVLAGCGTGRQQRLLEIMSNESMPVPRRVIEELAPGAARPDVRQALIKRLAHPDPLTEVDLVRAAARAGPAAAPEILAAWKAEDLSDAGSLVLLMALGRIGPGAKSAAEPLRETMAAADTHPLLRAAIRVTLANLGDTSRENLDALRAAVAGHDEAATTTLQMVALGGGADWADEAFVAETVRQFESDPAETGFWAAAALGRLGAKAGPKAVAALKQSFVKCLEEPTGNPLLLGCCLARMDGPNAATYLEPVLARLGRGGLGEGAILQMQAVRGALLDPSLAADLARFLDSPRPEVQRGALWALAGVAGLESGAAWRRVLDLAAKAEDESLRRDAVMVLAVVLPAEEVGRLETMMREAPSEEIKSTLSMSLRAVRLGPGPMGPASDVPSSTDEESLEWAKKNAAKWAQEGSLDKELGYKAYEGHAKTVEFLLAQGADPNYTETFSPGQTPLHLAAAQGHVAVITLLLDAGADINAVGSGDTTPLNEAVFPGRKAAAELLIRRGASLEIGDCTGMTPLIWAAYLGNLEMATLLVENKAQVDARDKGGNTALMDAIRLFASAGEREDWGKPDYMGVIKLLLTHGADVNLTNNYGDTPLKIAKEYRRSSVINLLRQHGARE